MSIAKFVDLKRNDEKLSLFEAGWQKSTQVTADGNIVPVPRDLDIQ